MTNRVDSAPFLPEAPIYDKVLDDNGYLTDSWRNWVNAITRVTGYAITHGRFATSRQETPLTEAISLPDTATRNDLLNPKDSTYMYNVNTGRFNFREGGAWVTFAPIPVP